MFALRRQLIQTRDIFSPYDKTKFQEETICDSHMAISSVAYKNLIGSYCNEAFENVSCLGESVLCDWRLSW